MKTIGLIGGMSWESTIPYYKIINECVAKSLGGLHSAQIILYSLEFAQIEKWQTEGEWGKCAEVLREAAARLEKAGAELILICTNTQHMVYPEVAAAVSVPVLHIADATADVLEEAGMKKVGLLGTRYTLTEKFYRERLEMRGFEVVLPGPEDIEEMNRIIFEELCLGEFRAESRARVLDMIAKLKAGGAEAAILGCTEIGLLLGCEGQETCGPGAAGACDAKACGPGAAGACGPGAALPLFDTTLIHATRAAELALN